MKAAEEVYDTASNIFRETSDQGLSRLLQAKCLFARFWLTDLAHERSSLISQLLPVAKEAVKLLELTDDKRYTAEALRALLQYYFEALGLSTKSEETRARLERAASVVERAVQGALAIGDDEMLIEILEIATRIFVVLNTATDPSGYKIHSQRALELASQASTVSARVKTSRGSALSAIAMSLVIGYLKADPVGGIAQAEAGLKDALITGDSFLIGFLTAIGSFFAGMAGMREEDVEKKRQLLEKSLYLVKTALPSLEISIQGAIGGWAAYWYADCHTTIATNVETEVEKKRALLSKAVEIAKQGMTYENFGTPFSGPEFALTKALQFQAVLEPDRNQRLELLSEALQSSEREVNRRSSKYPDSWDLGIACTYLAKVKSELGKEGSVSEKTDYLRSAVTDMEKSVKFLGEWGPIMGRTHILASAEEAYGDILAQLHDSTHESSLTDRTVGAYEKAVAHLSEMGLAARSGSVRWKIARVFDSDGDFARASVAFKAAALDYEKAAAKLPRLSTFFGDLHLYMESWSCIDEARIRHNERNFSVAADNYTRASNILQATKRWNHLYKHYFACSLLERGEGQSRGEKHEESSELFRNASKEFGEALLKLKMRMESSTEPEEKSELTHWTNVTEGRARYCLAKSLLEEARFLDKEEKNDASLRKYREASEAFSRLTSGQDLPREQREIETATLFCKAWAIMKEAEMLSSSQLYREAAGLFIKAESVAVDDRFRLLAQANSAVCKALVAANQFRRNRNPRLYSKVKGQLEAAGDQYERAGFAKAAGWARATQRFFDALAYITDAETERDAAKKSSLYDLAEKQFARSSKLYAQAGFVVRDVEARKLLRRAREEKELFTPSRVVIGSPIAFQGSIPTSLVRDRALGLERLESVSISGKVNLPERVLRTGSPATIELEMTNLGKNIATLIRIEGLSSEGLEILGDGQTVVTSENSIELNGKRLGYLRSFGLNLKAQGKREGIFELRPRVIVCDEKGKQGAFEFEPATLIVRTRDFPESFQSHASKRLGSQMPVAPKEWFETDRAREVFQFLTKDFIADYVGRGLLLEDSGWRTLMGMVREAEVPRSAFYRTGGGDGAVLAELDRRGLVERRVFSKERGRGGAVTKMRIAYDNDAVRKFLRQTVFEGF
jgi:hypothetical protein